jgi:hypothetical protein
MLPVIPRLPGVGAMIEDESYFILHGPRQSGKTTFIKTLANNINSEGRYYALFCSLQTLRGVGDKTEAMDAIASLINKYLKGSSLSALNELAFPDDSIPQSGFAVKIVNLLNYLCVNLDKDLVVFFDEADCLSGPPLISFLAQIRDGYNDRFDSPRTKFPRSLALVGMRNIRDYLASNHPKAERERLASPFNIVTERMTLANFTQDEIGCLYRQHTDATGQPIMASAIERAWHWTGGQPWLVNSLANEIVVKQLGRDYSRNIAGSNVDQAAQSLITSNDAHFDSLRTRLDEPKVRRVMEPIVVSAESLPLGLSDDDISYVFDLGLLKKDMKNDSIFLPANPIYEEVIARTLSRGIQQSLPTSLSQKWMDERSIDMSGLLKAFQIYWKETAELLKDKTGEEANDNAFKTNENLVILVLYAFLQRVINGGAEIKREYALGRLRVDICVTYKGHHYPLEVKIKGHKSEEDNIEQLLGYMDRCGSSVGWLVVCDKNLNKIWRDKLSFETNILNGQTIHIISC